MFYDSQIMNSKSLKNAWRAGNNQELSSEDVPLPNVCTRLDSWIASDYMDPCRRLSLRASSILVGGAAKLYKQGLNNLIQDACKMEYHLITRKRPRDYEAHLSDSSMEEFEHPNANKPSPPGHTASAVKFDRFDGQKGGNSKRNNAAKSQGKRRKININDETRTITKDKRQTESERPIGQIFVYENMASKIPTKIIIGNVNADVKKTIKFK